MSTKVYEIVTQKVLEMMDKGVVPWRKAWKTVKPCNISGRQYSGGNLFLISCLGFETPVFLTFNQIKKLNGKIKEGQEKNHFPIFFWSFVEKVNAAGKKETFPIFRFFLVWNFEQVEGIELPEACKLIANENPVPMESAERVISNMPNPPAIKEQMGSSRACYAPQSDCVTIPSAKQFKQTEDYYSTFFHELGHSTGHSSRLNRKEVNDPIVFGSHDYSVEELVAEMTAAFLCAETGIANEKTEENSAAYIKGWYAKLSSDPKLFWTAASRAQKAADYILNRKADDKDSE